MKYDDVTFLREHSSAWRLLRADNAPLVLSFLHRVFVEGNARSVSASELAGQLDDDLYALNDRLGAGTYPKPAHEYLNDWAKPEVGWLHKYYPSGSDEPHFDATPAVKKALCWLRSLEARSFIGTESRLNTLFELLRQIVYGADDDPEVRLAELQRRRHEIDVEIAEVERGNMAVLEPSAQRDRYQQFADTARRLLADFREVEANFRALDRELRERIAGWSGSKGELLDEVLGDRDAIAESDQGRSFQAFYDFLLSPQRQSELTELLDKVHRWRRSTSPTLGCAESTTTGSTPASRPTPPSGCCPTSYAASSTTRRGWRTAGPAYVRVRSLSPGGDLAAGFGELTFRVDDLAVRPLPHAAVYVIENETVSSPFRPRRTPSRSSAAGTRRRFSWD